MENKKSQNAVTPNAHRGFGASAELDGRQEPDTASTKNTTPSGEFFRGKRILVTGGAGTVGKEVVSQLLAYQPEVVRVFSRDEGKHYRMEQEFGERRNIRYLLGDVRDLDRLRMAVRDIDVVFHCAGLKHVKYCEYNPFEAVRTNIMGTQNMILNALEENVEKVIFSSSDKAVNPSNALGASKLMAERLMTAANCMRGRHRTVFASVRFGNVIGSGGSVLPLFINQIRAGGPVTVTDPRMTRFIMSLRQAVGLMIKAAQMARGGEVFTLRMPAVRIQDLAQVMIDEIAGGMPIPIKFIGTKPGEKIDEELLTEDELKRSEMLEDLYVTYPTNPDERPPMIFGGVLPSNLSYCSKDNGMLDRGGIRHFLEEEGLLETDGSIAFHRIPRFEWRGA